jgi:signal transduction histidine kinase
VERKNERQGFSPTRLIPEFVALAVMTTVLLFVRHQFADSVHPALLGSWLAFMTSCIVARIVSVIAGLRSDGAAGERGPGGRYITLAFCLGIVASVWILMPAADPMLRLIMIILCMWFIAMVIILNPDALAVAGSLAVVASMAAFALFYRIPYSLALAGFLLMEGAALIMIRRMSVRASRALEGALAVVQAERDAKTRFLAAASHDLQQPIMAARLYFDRLLADPSTAQRERAASGGRAAFEATQKLLESMLEHLRLEALGVQPRIAVTGLIEAGSSALLEHEPSLRAAGIEARLAGRIEALADEHLVRRILSNLVVNTVRHSGGRRLLIGARRRDRIAELWVIDDGAGIAPADLPQLFKDYFQGTDRATQRVGGFGLGLASARRMAELMGGSLDIDPRWRSGSAFVLRLPAAT